MKDNMVIFTDKDHSYRYNGDRYESVSGVFKIAKPYTDWNYNAGRSFFKKNYPDLYVDMKKELSFDHPELVDALIERSGIGLKKYKEERDKLRAEWADTGTTATTRGTAFHTLKENEDYERGWAINPATGVKTPVVNADKEYDNQSLAENLYDLPDGYYPELLIFNHEYKIAGQADKVFIRTEGKDRFVDIDDWKTDANIFLKPDFRHPRKGYEMLEYPLNHLYHTNHNIYMIKIGVYAWMMEQFGFKVGKLFFTSVDITDELELLSEKRYELPYKSWEAGELVKHFREKHPIS